MEFTGSSSISGGRRGCDICQSAERNIVHEQRFVNFDDDLGLLLGYNVAVCDICGFVYADGLPGPEVFERYYRDMSKHEPAFDAARPAPAYRTHNVEMIVSSVAKHLPDRFARILDVGVGSGEILLALRERGYCELTGLDPSHRTARILHRSHGLRVLNTPVSQLDSCEERFDIIMLTGVLEHLRDLRPTLLLLKTLLREAGAMCVAVPDASRFPGSVESPFQYFSVEHINFFTRGSLESLFAGVGMELQDEVWESTALLGAFREPVIQGIFRPTAHIRRPVRDSAGTEHIARYIERCHESQNSLVAKIRDLADSGEGVIVWGAGSLTMHLLSDPRLAGLNIVAFVDGNENYWDKAIRGVRVISPQAVGDLQETILIVSYSYEDEIHAEIRYVYGLGNRVVKLFGRDEDGTPVVMPAAG